MNLYLKKFAEGAKEAIEEYKNEPSVFDIKGGNLFPHHTSQKMWQFSKGDGQIHFYDGNATYSFKGDLNPEGQSVLEKTPDVPLPDMYVNHKSKGKAQVHRSDPGSIYFTLQEGKENPTFTFRHSSGSKWVAIPKPRKAKKQMEEEAYVPNINLEHVKEGMEAEIINFLKEGEGEPQGFFNHPLGSALQGMANLPATAALAPGRLMGSENQVGLDGMPTESLGRSAALSGIMGLGGAGLGAAYHYGKRHLYNTPEENAREDENPNTLQNRMIAPALALGGAAMIGRRAMPNAMNHPDWKAFE